MPIGAVPGRIEFFALFPTQKTLSRYSGLPSPSLLYYDNDIMELDHFFILTDRPAVQAGILSKIGLAEGTPNDHPGQGTSNRRFFFCNTALELLYVRDAKEAEDGPGRRLRFPDRAFDASSSPFGLITRDDSSEGEPYAGWLYQPDYFQPGYGFLIGENSDLLDEPLCVHMPFKLPPPTAQPVPIEPFSTVTELRVHVPVTTPSDVLRRVSRVRQITLVTSAPHLLELVFNNAAAGQFRDLRPVLPLQIRW